MSLENFELLTDKLQGKVKFLYLHLMGEPLLHPDIAKMVAIAREKGFLPIVTTNGVLIDRAEALIDALPHKMQISLHSHEGQQSAVGQTNDESTDAERYIDSIMRFSIDAAKRGIYIVLRLWNEGGYNKTNALILDYIAKHVPRPWVERYDGYRIAENIYVESDNMFTWPDEKEGEHYGDDAFCYALRNQIGVLVDGSVVPCCLDSNGSIKLGNLYEQSLEEILSSPRAKAMYDGFTHHKATETLCQHCGYAAVNKRFRKESL